MTIEEQLIEINKQIDELEDKKEWIVQSNLLAEYNNTYYKEVCSYSKIYYYIKSLHLDPTAFNNIHIQGLILYKMAGGQIEITNTAYTRKTNLIESTKEEFDEAYANIMTEITNIITTI